MQQKKGVNPGCYSNVQNDRQWVRRCKQEEINLIDSYAGAKAARIEQATATQSKNRFYPPVQRMPDVGPTPASSKFAHMEETKQMQQDAYSNSKASKARGIDSDGLDSVSKVSVTTPHTMSVRTDEVSYVSMNSKTTTQSTRIKLLEVQAQLDAERARRQEAERKIREITGKPALQ